MLVLISIAMVVPVMGAYMLTFKRALAFKRGEDDKINFFTLFLFALLCLLCIVPPACGFPDLYTFFHRLRTLNFFGPAHVVIPPRLQMTQEEIKQSQGAVAMAFWLILSPQYLTYPLFCYLFAPPLPFAVTSYSHLLQTHPMLGDYDIVMTTGASLGLANDFTFYDQRSDTAILPLFDPTEWSGHSFRNLTQCPAIATAETDTLSFKLWALRPAANATRQTASPAVSHPGFLRVRKYDGVDYSALVREARTLFGLPLADAAEVTVFSLHPEFYLAYLLVEPSVWDILEVLGYAMGCVLILFVHLRRWAAVHMANVRQRRQQGTRYWKVPPSFLDTGSNGKVD